MKTYTHVLFISFLLVSCGGGGGGSGSSAKSPDITNFNCSTTQYTNFPGVGDFVECKSGYVWFKDGNNYFGIDSDTGNIREESALYFDDVGCTNLIGTVNTYPLTGYGGDIYTFNFDGDVYEFILGNPVSDYVNVYKLENDVCSFVPAVSDIQETQAHGGSVQISYDQSLFL